MDFFARVIECLRANYPKACDQYRPRENLHPLLICPDVIELPKKLALEAQTIVKAFSELREIHERSERLSLMDPATPDPGNYSALMSYDFHVDEAGALRLIEINTNASLSLVANCLEEVHGLQNIFVPSFRDEIAETFINEAKLNGRDGKLRIAIVDSQPEKQRLYFEFLLFKELFEQRGHEVLIADTSSLTCIEDTLRVGTRVIDLVYNRDTDFYFEHHPEMRRAMLNDCATLSPHPHEYRLLADKERLLELSRPEAITTLPISADARLAIEKTLIKTRDIRSFADSEALWAARKKLFFKPMRSFGGKAAYRGSSVTRTAFTQLFEESYVAQDFVPAPTVVLKSRKDEEPFKYDLRFYVYRDRIQLACARTYRGQMTNSQTPGGGVTAIKWMD